MAMLWIALDPSMHDHKTNREQFNGPRPAWGESDEDWSAKQGVDVPQVGDQLALRMGLRTVEYRRLEMPDKNEEGPDVTGWYWTIVVR